jgi:dihydropteroate synthase
LPPVLLERLAAETGPQPRTLVMGVVNVTPDSFSDGGLWLEPDAGIAHGLELHRQGADLVDVGGESTRPGAERPSIQEELRRVLPVVRELSAAGVVVSVDTMRAVVAEAALAAGATLVNDVSGGLADPDLPSVVAAAGVPYVAMHWRAHSTLMERYAVYDDVVTEVTKELSLRLEALVALGLPVERIALDPGLGFAKNTQHNWALLHGLEQLLALGRPLVLGASRKRFLGALLSGPTGDPAPPVARDDATHATSALAAAAGVWCVRVHDVPGTRDAVRVAAAWMAGHA